MSDNLRLAYTITGRFDGKQTVAEASKVEGKIREIRKRNEEATRTAAELKKEYGLTDEEVEVVTKELLKAADAAEKLKKEAAETNQELERSALKAAGAIGGALTAAVGGVFVKGAQGAAEYERILGGVAEGLEKTNGSAGVTLDQIVNFADGLGDATLTSEEATLRASRALLSFRSISGDTFFRTLAVSQDLAESLEGDLEANLIQVAKALEDPVRGLTALSRSGTQFTAQQTEQIKALVASGDQLAAQELILAELEKQYGGTAVAAAQGLTGALDTLGENANDTFRVFGDQVLPIATQVVNVFSGLLDTFTSAPPVIQRTIVGTTALAGVLGAAVVAITAYNLAKKTQVVQETLATAAKLKEITATAGKTAVTATATAAQNAYAIATGRATAAQLASAKAIAASATTMAAFAGAVAAVALVVDTFRSVDAAAARTRDSTAAVRDSLIELQNVGGDAGQAVGAGLDEAAANAEGLAASLNPVQQGLDVLRGVLPGVATAAEAASNRSQVAFSELTLAVGEVEGEAANLRQALNAGLEVDPQKVGAVVTSINTSIEALKAQQPVTEQEIALRDAQISRLETHRDAISETTGVSQDLTDATGALASQVANLSDELKKATAELDANALAQEAAIQESLANGQITQDQANQQLANNEQQNLQDRIAAASEKVAELQELKAGATDPAEVEEINAQILEVENQLNRDRITLAQSTVSAKRDAEQAAEQAAKDAEKAATDAAKEETEKRKALAQDEADALKEAREDAKRQSEETFEEGARGRQDTFDRGREQRAEQLEQRLNTLRESGQAEVEKLREESEESLQADREKNQKLLQNSDRAYEKAKQQQQKAFQKTLQQERDRESSRIDAAASEAEFQTARRLAQESGDEEAVQRLDDERELAQRRAEILAEEQTKALRNVDEGEALTPIEQARLDLEERIQAKQEAFAEKQATADETRQAAREQKARELEDELTEKRKVREAEIAELQKTNEAELEEVRKQAAADERQLQATFEQNERTLEAQFKETQRQLDKQNAQEIKRILDSTDSSTPRSLRSGGNFAANEVLDIHKDERVVFSRPGTVLSQRASRAVVREVLTGQQVAKLEAALPASPAAIGFSQVANHGIETRLDKVARGLKRIERQGLNAANPAVYNFHNDPDPYRSASRARRNELARKARRVGV
ncbi:MAG: hypothetical protein AAGD09_11605 [Cyanobacteria bacterium P01_F01_bin.56]